MLNLNMLQEAAASFTVVKMECTIYANSGCSLQFSCFGLGGSDDHHMMGYDGEKSIQRFDSNSMKPDRSRGFGSDDESDPFGAFGDSGPFSAGTAKQTNVWSAF